MTCPFWRALAMADVGSGDDLRADLVLGRANATLQSMLAADIIRGWTGLGLTGTTSDPTLVVKIQPSGLIIPAEFRFRVRDLVREAALVSEVMDL